MRKRSTEAKKIRAAQARAKYAADPERERARKRAEYEKNGRKSIATAAQRREWKRNWKLRHPEQARAHDLVKQALRSGQITKPDHCEHPGCEVTDPLEAHHDDYNQPLKVKWLCLRHHGRTRRKI